jgi:Tfp pilus assembly protein PilX
MTSARGTIPRRSATAEDGFIMIMAILVLFILSLLVAVAVAMSVQASTSTTRDSASKAGLAAAEAGLQVAAYRLTEYAPAKTECYGSAKETASKCESGSESLGNGATFQYTTTKSLESGECAGKSISVIQNAVQRCITSEGKVTGDSSVTRLQALVQSSLGEALFDIKGILGLEEVLVSGSVKATAIVASNKKIKGEGSAAFEKGYELCPGGEFKPKAGTERNQSGVTVDGIGGTQSAGAQYEKERGASECPITATIPTPHATATENNDSRITNKEDPQSEGYYPKPPIEGEPPSWTASTYELSIGSGNSQLTLEGSKYYFCKLIVNGKLKITASHPVEIFIDSHEDDSKCPSGSGEFKVSNNGHIENTAGSGNLLIEMAGKGPIGIENSGTLTASIYAPEAEVVLSGAGALTGALVGKTVHLTAGSFIYSTNSENLEVSGSSGSSYVRKAWDQCTSATKTETGC